MGKKIISFALYGNNPMYTQGAIENAKLQKHMYPGWVCRFYVNKFVDKNIVLELQRLGAEVVIIKAPPTWKSKFIRIEVAFDRTVERFIIRDCDSRLNKKEAISVQEWIESGKPVHIMRDHRRHTSPMMGGMWGAVNGFVEHEDLLRLYKNWIQDLKQGKHKGQPFCKADGRSDQGFLGNRIFPLMKNLSYCNTSHKKFTENDRPFTASIGYGHFIGQQVTAKNRWLKP